MLLRFKIRVCLKITHTHTHMERHTGVWMAHAICFCCWICFKFSQFFSVFCLLCNVLAEWTVAHIEYIYIYFFIIDIVQGGHAATPMAAHRMGNVLITHLVWLISFLQSNRLCMCVKWFRLFCHWNRLSIYLSGLKDENAERTRIWLFRWNSKGQCAVILFFLSGDRLMHCYETFSNIINIITK